jgi:hypothetical protein
LVIHYDAEVNALDTVLDRIRAHMPGRTDGVAAAADRGANGHAHTNGHGPSGDMVRAAGQVFGQAVFATLVQRTLERSLLSLLTGIR